MPCPSDYMRKIKDPEKIWQAGIATGHGGGDGPNVIFIDHSRAYEGDCLFGLEDRFQFQDNQGGGYSYCLFNLGDNSKPYTEVNLTSWETVAAFYYPGNWRYRLRQFILTVARGGAIGTAYARLYDYTNNQVIATSSWTSDALTVIINEDVNNVPNEPAVLELQARKAMGSSVWLYSMQLR